MAAKGRVKVGIIGSGFEADIHAESFRIMPDEAEVVAVASPTPGHAAALAIQEDIGTVFAQCKSGSDFANRKQFFRTSFQHQRTSRARAQRIDHHGDAAVFSGVRATRPAFD